MLEENKEKHKLLYNSPPIKTKWFFLINNASFLMEFFGKLAKEAIDQGDECVGIINSKFAEYEKKNFFPSEMKFISKIDWCTENYQRDKIRFNGLSWRKVSFIFDRFERLNFTYNNSVEMVSQLYQFFEFLFKTEKPSIIISEPVSGLFNGIADYFCALNRVPYFGFSGSRFQNRIDAYDSEETYSEYIKTFAKLNNNNISSKEKKFAKNFIHKFVSHKELPSYMGVEKNDFSQFKIFKRYARRIKELGHYYFKYFLNRKYFKEFDYESENIFKNAFYVLFETEKHKFRILAQKNIFNFLSDLKDNKQFFLFPLHFQPESSTSVLANYLCDQLNTIKNIAFTLPFPYKLYVKEHPMSIGCRSKSFYEQLKKIPNVVLISPKENTADLIEKSSGVITLTGTIGIEAILVGKPVYVLGKIFYTYHPLCRKIENFDDLKNKLLIDLVRKPNIVNLEDINLRFITSYLRNTIIGNIVSGSTDHDINDYSYIYDNVRKMLEKKVKKQNNDKIY